MKSKAAAAAIAAALLAGACSTSEKTTPVPQDGSLADLAGGLPVPHTHRSRLLGRRRGRRRRRSCGGLPRHALGRLPAGRDPPRTDMAGTNARARPRRADPHRRRMGHVVESQRLDPCNG